MDQTQCDSYCTCVQAWQFTPIFIRTNRGGVESAAQHIGSLEAVTKLSCAVIYVLTEESCGKSTAQYEPYQISYRHS